jgi:hypothetical protein
MRSSFGWAWRRSQEHVVGFLVGVVILGALGVVVANVLTAPTNSTVEERIAYGVAGFLGSVLLALAAAFAWALIRAPHEQRNALRRNLRKLQDSVDEQGARRKRLLEDRVLTNEAFYIWELLKPGERPLIQNREFIDCTMKGPAIISPQMSVSFDQTMLGAAPIDSLIYDLVPGQRQGLIAIINSKFTRGSLEGIGYYVDKDVRAKLEGTRVI